MSPAEEAEFWSKRGRKVGHTGWKQPVIYAFDQRQRLRLVERCLSGLGLPRGARVLDFGCGTGDFSRLLLQQGHQVFGYDPYFEPTLSHPRFRYLKQVSELERLEPGLDLILSVTVLDHVLDDGELAALLERFRHLASSRGTLVALEYAPEREAPPPAPHQAYRSLASWRRLLNGAGWSLQQQQSVAHPKEAPSLAFQRYHRSLVTRVLSRGVGAPVIAPAVRWALGLRAGLSLARHASAPSGESPLKLLLCRTGGEP